MKKILYTMLLVSSLFGHRLYILADDDGKNLYIKSYFTKNSACKNCQVRVYNNKKIINSGQTDNNGKITFKLEEKNIDIEVTASMGHKNIINYNSENEIITENKNITIEKILISLSIIALLFLLLRILKK